jgi:transcriptional regulator with XRE-family HTH domain
MFIIIMAEAFTPAELRQVRAQLRQARAALEWSMADLAEKAGVHFNTVWRAENGKTAPGPAVDKIVAALEEHGVEFLAGGGVRLREMR